MRHLEFITAGTKGSAGETQPLSAGLLRGRALRCSPALPEYPGAAHLRKGEAGWAGASLEKDTCQRRLGSMPQSQPPPPSLHGSGPQRGLPGRPLPRRGAKPWKNGGFFVTRRFRAQQKPGSTRRGRILGTAALVTWGQGAASQTGQGRSEPAGQGAHRRAPGEPGQQSGREPKHEEPAVLTITTWARARPSAQPSAVGRTLWGVGRVLRPL